MQSTTGVQRRAKNQFCLQRRELGKDPQKLGCLGSLWRAEKQPIRKG